MACKDPSITYLNKFGYNVVRLPRVGVEPLDVVGRDRSTEWLGSVSSVWKSNVPPPTPGPPRIAVDVQGRKSDKLDLSIGLKILSNVLKAFGATVPSEEHAQDAARCDLVPGFVGGAHRALCASLEFAFQRARKITFTFANVTSTSIAPFDTGNLANGAWSLEGAIAFAASSTPGEPIPVLIRTGFVRL